MANFLKLVPFLLWICLGLVSSEKSGSPPDLRKSKAVSPNKNGSVILECTVSSLLKLSASADSDVDNNMDSDEDVITDEASPTITWYFVNDDIEAKEEQKDGVTYEDNGETSILTLTDSYRPGKYRCEIPQGGSMQFNALNNFRLDRQPKSYTVIEGEDQKIYCRLRAGSDLESNPKFSWFRRDEHDPKAPGVEITNSAPVVNELEPHLKYASLTNRSILKIEDAIPSDRGLYECICTNDYGQTLSQVTMVRIKQKYAALYPFVGIVIEVFLLCFIIFICEQRAKTPVEEEEYEEDLNGAPHGNSSVRNRRH